METLEKNLVEEDEDKEERPTVSVDYDGLVVLDFHDYGIVSVPKRLAMAMVSDQSFRDEIRRKCLCNQY